MKTDVAPKFNFVDLTVENEVAFVGPSDQNRMQLFIVPLSLDNCHGQRACRPPHLNEIPAFYERVIFAIAFGEKHAIPPNVNALRFTYEHYLGIDQFVDEDELAPMILVEHGLRFSMPLTPGRFLDAEGNRPSEGQHFFAELQM